MVEIKRLNERLLIEFVNYHELFVLHVSRSISFSATDTYKERKDTTYLSSKETSYTAED